MIEVQLKDLLEAGCHFGHEVKRWHPKASSFIYTHRDKIHIIDLAKTRDGLLKAGEYAKQLGLQGKKLLFVGTKRQAKIVTKQEAVLAGAPYFSQRWVGGFLTNWSEIKKNLDKLNKMDSDKAAGAWSKFKKHEQLLLDRNRMRLEKFYGGVKNLKVPPDALFVVDIKKEAGVIAEATQMGVPVIGIVDTNSDPTNIEYPIPANDDAVKSITFLVTYIAQAYGEGVEEFKKQAQKTAAVPVGKPVQVIKEVKVEKKVPTSRTKDIGSRDPDPKASGKKPVRAKKKA